MKWRWLALVWGIKATWWEFWEQQKGEIVKTKNEHKLSEAQQIVNLVVLSYKVFCIAALVSAAILILIRNPGGGVGFLQRLFGISATGQSAIYLICAAVCLWPHPLTRLWVYMIAITPLLVYGLMTVALVLIDPIYANASLIMVVYYFGLWLAMILMNLWLSQFVRLALIADEPGVIYRYVYTNQN